jgi:hypothetical protein
MESIRDISCVIKIKDHTRYTFNLYMNYKNYWKVEVMKDDQVCETFESKNGERALEVFKGAMNEAIEHNKG